MTNKQIKDLSAKGSIADTDQFPLDDASNVTYKATATVLKAYFGNTDATLTFTDVTTNNSSSTKHGFLVKLPSSGGLLTRLNGLNAFVQNAVYKTADETVNNSTAMQNDDELLWAISNASEVWGFEVNLWCLSVSTGSDIKIGWSVPSGTTMLWAPAGTVGQNVGSYIDNGAASSIDGGTGLAAASTVSLAGGNATYMINLKGVVFGGSTAGNVNLQWAQASATAENTKVLKGSHIILTRLA